MTIAVFGHHDADSQSARALFDVIAKLAFKHERVDCLIGHQGQFDRLALHTIRQMQNTFSNIRCTIVLSRLPAISIAENIETIYPESVAQTPPRFSIIARNHWMIDQADLVVLYLKYSPSNVAKCKQYAERTRKPIIVL